jgi:hypothetical protein
MEYAMLAEIFMLRAETAAREAAKDAARFVPITLPATVSTVNQIRIY